MGLIRGGLVTIVAVLLLISLLVGNLFLTLNLSLDYENIQPELASVVREFAMGGVDLAGEIGENIFVMEAVCKKDIEYVFYSNELGRTVTVPCEVVAQGSDAVIEHSVANMIENAYYEDYECSGFTECAQNPFYLVSKDAKDYWNKLYYFMLVVSILLAGALLFVIHQKTNFPFLLGVLVIAAALPFVSSVWLVKLLGIIFFFLEDTFLAVFSVFFSKSGAVFWTSFVLGLILVGAGIVFKLFGVGFKISNFFQKTSGEVQGKEKKAGETSVSKSEVKEIVREEVAKRKKKIKG